MHRLENRVALVTAAGSGMGRASAERFASEGAHVIVSDLDEAAADQRWPSRSRRPADRPPRPRATCVTSIRSRPSSTRIGRDHGVLHVLYNHAGIPGAGRDGRRTGRVDDSRRHQQRSAFYATSYALPLLRKADGQGLDHLHLVGVRRGRLAVQPALLDDQGRRRPAHEVARGPARPGGHPVQRDPAGDDRDADAVAVLRPRERRGHRGPEDRTTSPRAAGPGGPAGGDRQRRGLPGQRRRQLGDRASRYPSTEGSSRNDHHTIRHARGTGTDRPRADRRTDVLDRRRLGGRRGRASMRVGQPHHRPNDPGHPVGVGRPGRAGRRWPPGAPSTAGPGPRSRRASEPSCCWSWPTSWSARRGAGRDRGHRGRLADLADPVDAGRHADRQRPLGGGDGDQGTAGRLRGGAGPRTWGRRRAPRSCSGCRSASSPASPATTSRSTRSSGSSRPGSRPAARWCSSRPRARRCRRWR